MDLDAVGERPPVGVQAGIGGQQRGMNVEHSSFVARRRSSGAEDAHEPGQHDQVRRQCASTAALRPARSADRFGEVPWIDDGGRHAALRRDGEGAASARLLMTLDDVTRDQARALGVENRRHVRPAAGDEDDQPLHRAARFGPGSCDHRRRRRRVARVRRGRSRTRFRPPSPACASVASASPAATTRTRPMPQLNTRCISASCDARRCAGANRRSGAWASARHRCARRGRGGNMRCVFSSQPAAGDVRHALDFEPLSRASTGFDVDPRRLEQHLARACAQPVTPGSGRARSAPLVSRMRRMSEKPLACGPLEARPIRASPSTMLRPSMARVRSTTPTANPARSYSPATKARGCSAVSPPISAQPACSQPAAMPLMTALATADVELLADVVVEKEQRLGALHQDVVDAHRDQVDADRVVPAAVRRRA